MLCARLTRVSPGRPEATLALVTITPRTPRRQQGQLGRYDGHVVIGPGSERAEEHVHVTGWDRERPAIDLLQHVLEVAQNQRRGDVAPDAVTMPGTFAAFALRCIDFTIGQQGIDLEPEDEQLLEQLRTELARADQVAA